jgi:hypothetical protein
MADTKTMMLLSAIGGPLGGAMGAFSNQYCYVGMTNTRFVSYVMGIFGHSQTEQTVHTILLKKSPFIRSQFDIYFTKLEK